MTIEAEAPSANGEYGAALDAAMNAPTAYARSKAVDALEALALERSNAQPSPDSEGAGAEAFPAPETASAYEFANLPGVEPMSEGEVGEVRTALFSAGIPSEFVGQGYQNLQRLEQSGALSSDAAFEQACGKCRADLEKLHGSEASAMIRDGVAYIEAIAKAHPTLEHAATAALADPYMLSTAANLKRYGVARR